MIPFYMKTNRQSVPELITCLNIILPLGICFASFFSCSVVVVFFFTSLVFCFPFLVVKGL